MSTYCKIVILINDEADVHTLLTKFAIECFNAREAIQMSQDQFNIDAGLNDVRAVVKYESHFIAFCCRYQHDVQRIENRIQNFVRLHDLKFEIQTA